MHITDSFRLLVALATIGLLAACGDGHDSSRATANTSARPWIEEAEFTADRFLAGTPEQVILLDLEASPAAGPSTVRNTARLMVERDTEMSLCIAADEAFVTEIEMLSSTGQTLVRAQASAECGSATIASGVYELRIMHDGSRIGPRARKAFLRPAAAPPADNTPSSFVIPDFMAFATPPAGVCIGGFVTDAAGGSSPPYSVGPGSSTVDAHAVWRLSEGPINYSFSNTINGAIEVNPQCILANALITGSDGNLHTEVATFALQDQGNWSFTLETPTPCGYYTPILGCPLDYVNQPSNPLTPTTFTANFKGYDCTSPCTSDVLALEQGEVALFAGCNYTGKAFVFRTNVPDFSIYNAAAGAGLAMGDDMVSSVRVGPNTLAYLYANSHYAGVAGAVGLDAACLTGTPLDSSAASSMQVAEVDVKQLIVSTNQCENCIISGIDLSDLDLSGGDFAGSRMTGGNLTNTLFRGATLDDVDLSGSTILSGTDFSDASLRCADFNGTTLTSAIFNTGVTVATDFSCRIDVSEAVLGASIMPTSLWRYLNLSEATIINDTGQTPLVLSTIANPLDLSGALLGSVTGLSGAVLDGANLGCATPDAANHNCVQLIDTDLNDISLQQVNLSNAALNGAKLIHANLARANLRGAQLLKSPTTLSSANLTGASLKNANLSEADLSGATLTNANWYSSSSGLCSGSTWNGNCASGQGATLSNANLSGSYLNGLDLSDTTAQGTKFTGALLVGANFTNANLSGDPNTGANTDFSGAFLQGADFTDANATGADFASAYIDVTSESGGFLIWQLPTSNLEFAGYTPPVNPPECVLFESTQQTQVQTIAGNLCPDGESGQSAGQCTNTQWSSPLTPIDNALPPSSSNLAMLPGECTGLDFDW